MSLASSVDAVRHQLHQSVMPVSAAGVSCAIGFNMHEVLGYVGQCVGILSGLLSVSWVAYQFYRSLQRGKRP